MKLVLIVFTLLSHCLSNGLSKYIGKLSCKLNWKPIVTFASSCLLSVTPYDVSRAVPLPASSLSLEQSVERLETADSRADALQAMVRNPRLISYDYYVFLLHHSLYIIYTSCLILGGCV